MRKVKFREDPAEVRFDRVARFYDTFNFFMERFTSKHRKEILRQARGNILEVGVGTGSSFKDYPPSEQIVAVDISKEMLRRAEEKLKNYNGKIELRREECKAYPSHNHYTKHNFTMFSMNMFITVFHGIIVALLFYYPKTMFEASFSTLPVYIYMRGVSINRNLP